MPITVVDDVDVDVPLVVAVVIVSQQRSAPAWRTTFVTRDDAVCRHFSTAAEVAAGRVADRG